MSIPDIKTLRANPLALGDYHLDAYAAAWSYVLRLSPPALSRHEREPDCRYRPRLISLIEAHLPWRR